MATLRPPDPPFQARRLRGRNVQEYGEIDLTGKRDCSYALNQAFADACEYNDVDPELPAGRLRISQPLVWRNPTPRISGAGARTIIVADGTDFDWLTVGGGWDTGSVGPSGWVRDFKLHALSEADAPSGFNGGLVLNGCWHPEIRNVWVDHAPVGFDLRNNNFGASFYNCRTSFGRCRIGVRLSGTREGMVFASGSDQSFYNCWLAGRDAAVWMERSGGGYNFFGGQMLSGSGLSVQDTTLGTLVVNKNLEEVGIVGGRMSARFFGTSFESASYMSNVRIHDLQQDPNGCQLLFSGVSFTGGTQADAVVRLTGGYNDTIIFQGCGLNGAWTNAVPLALELESGASRPQIVEFGTQSYGATFDGVQLDINTLNMCCVSNVQRAFGNTAFHFLIPGMLLYGGDAALQFSKDLTGGTGFANV